MNVLSGTIKDILNQGNLSLVKVQVNQVVLTSIVIEKPESTEYMKIGIPVKVMFKETEVIMSKDMGPGISLQNQIPVVIKDVNEGTLLSELTLDYLGNTIRSIITSRAVHQLGLGPGTKAVAMIKTNEVMLSS